MVDFVSAWGAGDPAGPSPDGPFPWGAGDPSPASLWHVNGADPGAGDPTLSLLSASLLPAQPGAHSYPDDGGEWLAITAPWTTAGPFAVALRETHTGQTFSCWGGPGNGANCYVTPDGELLAAMPAAPPGVYDVVIAWASGAVTISAALHVIWRGRSLEQWAIAARYRPADRAGPRDARVAALLGV